MYLEELKKEIYEYEKKHNTKDIVGRRLFNRIKTLQGGGKTKKRKREAHSSRSPFESVTRIGGVVRYVTDDPAYRQTIVNFAAQYDDMISSYFARPRLQHPHQELYGIYLLNEHNKVIGGIKPAAKPFELFPSPNPHQIRAFYFTDADARKKVENYRRRGLDREQYIPYIISFRRLHAAIQMQPPASKQSGNMSTVVAE